MSGGRRTDVLVIVLISFRAPCTAWMAVALVAAIAVVTGKEIGRDRIQEGERERDTHTHTHTHTQTDRRSTKEVKNEHSLCSRSRSLAVPFLHRSVAGFLMALLLIESTAITRSRRGRPETRASPWTDVSATENCPSVRPSVSRESRLPCALPASACLVPPC